LIERFFQGLSVAIETVRIDGELMEIWPNEVCDTSAVRKDVPYRRNRLARRGLNSEPFDLVMTVMGIKGNLILRQG